MSEDVFTWRLLSLAGGKYSVSRCIEQPAISVHGEVAKNLLEVRQVPYYLDRNWFKEKLMMYERRRDLIHDLTQ